MSRVLVSGLLVWCIALSVGLGFYVLSLNNTDDSNNRTACVSTVILSRLKASSEQAATDKTVSPSSQARSAATAVFEGTLIDALRPSSHDPGFCYRLIGIPEPK